MSLRMLMARARLALSKEFHPEMATTRTTETETGKINPSIASEETPRTFNLHAYLIGTQRMHEIETIKGAVIIESRHSSARAGGPC